MRQFLIRLYFVEIGDDDILFKGIFFLIQGKAVAKAVSDPHKFQDMQHLLSEENFGLEGPALPVHLDEKSCDSYWKFFHFSRSPQMMSPSWA